ncbi:DUF742 domain-containing protein [Pseudonocardia sp. WMMC193]|uniref:DUF742 domain-containing protein n=1 Tax=Pseudonocardia sp. WMMC193 TaxID=2911965 RepID=UPI001F2C528B|nr:DUF742 domain-containing protein [Pseudonocardia sp. WMMC193]MCF7553269.1 DUF742 domain-containing protein [Pseudonocardia sp. WMMC193]
MPVFAVTGGRTRSAGEELPLESIVTVTVSGRHAADLQLEYRTILGLATAPVSLVEIGAVLNVPVGVARVLVGDLADAGHVAVHRPMVDRDGTPGPEVLERLLEGLRARSA